jgi:hypothetical protein
MIGVVGVFVGCEKRVNSRTQIATSYASSNPWLSNFRTVQTNGSDCCHPPMTNRPRLSSGFRFTKCAVATSQVIAADRILSSHSPPRR